MSVPAPPRRNEPCPCGSGRRYKDCHGSLAAPPAAPTLDAQVMAALRLHQEGQVDAAERAYREILAKHPSHPVATHYLGMAAWQRGDAAEGERLMRESIRLDASIPDFHNNLGLLLRDARHTAEALSCFRRALEVDPTWFEAYNNLGLALEDAGEFDAALDAYREALAREPGFAAARQNLARLLLTTGHYAEGWEAYRWRLFAQGLQSSPPAMDAQRLPASLAGRRILLATEQGVGDVLFFLRFVPELVRRGAAVGYRGDARLYPLLARTGHFALGFGDAGAAAASETIFVGDLPWLLEAHDPVRFPAALRLIPLADRVAALRARLEALGPAPRIALTWRAGTVTAGGPVRAQLKEVPLAALAQALKNKTATWISVQRHPRAGETGALEKALGARVHDFSAANEDLEEILALLSLVDDYVGVSNANTHLRAGLDGTARVLVPFPPEWRWDLDPRSPWFAKMAIYRQSQDGDWSPALRELAAGL